MTAELILPAEAPRQEWLAARQPLITATDSAVILGLSPYDSPYGLFLRKRGEIGDKDVTEAMEWGTRLEPVIADAFADRHPEFEVCPGGLWRHPTQRFRAATPDRRLFERGGDTPVAELEIKSARLGAPGWGRDGSDEIPVYHTIQVQKQLDVLGLDAAYVAVLIGGQDYREYEIARDNELCHSIAVADEEFYRRLQAGIEPVADFSDATSDALAQRYPEAETGTETVLPPTAYELIDQYRTAVRDEKAAARCKTEATNRLKQLLGKAEVGLLDSRPVVRWSNSRRRVVTDLDALAATHPEFVTVAANRRLTVKGNQ